MSTNRGLRYVDTAQGFSGCLLAATMIAFYWLSFGYGIFKRLSRAASIANVTLHQLRHTFAAEFLRAGGNQFSLMPLLSATPASR